MNKQNVYVHTMERYSAFKKEIPIPATTWVSLEDIILSEMSMSQKGKYCMTPLVQGT